MSKNVAFSTPKRNEGSFAEEDGEINHNHLKSGQKSKEKRRREKKSNIFNEMIIVPIVDLNGARENREFRVEIEKKFDEDGKLDKFVISFYDNENIFFCMRCTYGRDDFKANKSNRFNVTFEGLHEAIIEMLTTFQKSDIDVIYTKTVNGALLSFFQTTELVRKELISFELSSISEEELDMLAQKQYSKVEDRLKKITDVLDSYNQKLKSKNPGIYEDIIKLGNNYVNSSQEKQKSLKYFLESNQKASEGMAQIQQKNLICPASLSPRKGKGHRFE